MSRTDRVGEFITTHSRTVIAVMLVLTLVVGAGAGMVTQSSSLDQFQTDSTAAEKQSYIETNFSTGDENTASAQIIVRGDNVLDKESLVGTLRLQQSFRNNETINRSLAGENSIVGVANVLAQTAIGQERAAELAARGQELQEARQSLQDEQAALSQRSEELNRTARELRTALASIQEVQRQYSQLNATYRSGGVNETTYERRATRLESRLASVRTNATADLNATESRTFARAAGQLRALQQNLTRLNATYEAGEINQSTYRQRAQRLSSNAEQVYRLGTRGVLAAEYAQLQERGQQLRERGQRLQERAQQLQEDQQALQNASSPTLAEQIDQLESMNASEIDDAVTTVLGEQAASGDSGGTSAFAFMPTGYEPGSTEANATMLVVTQQSGGGGGSPTGAAPDALVNAQNAMQSLADSSGIDAIVFGAGIISEEINQSMADSLAIVGPLALLFVVLTLIIAYRDLIDIVLGVFGIGAVLTWTFGFMGWADIAFNQMFIAVPVLLIGLSIDYAIHVFMRHREERAEHEGEGVRKSMTVALAGVGIALVWVTATTAIGFLSNLTSPIPPIQDFGIVSSVGIVAALLVFGVLVPALKVEIDGFLENRGFDRKKRAFGTGGGAFSTVLSAGSVAARKAPWVVIALALVVSAGGAYGAAQVDTSFSQQDFLAEDPAGWTKQLPEPFKPGEYNAKQNLEFVNENFIRQDSQIQILVEGGVATPDALRRMANGSDAATEKNVTQVLSSGEADIRSPLSVMQSVAAQNESFNATLAAADTDGDGVPDRNVGQVYDRLFAVAPDQAAGVVHRTDDGEYPAARMIVSVEGGASSDAITDQMREVATVVSGDGVTATATGQTIVFKIVQDELLQTVIESLVITLVAVFAFLMLTYRITEGSATLGAVTLLPVVFSVSWILGTMYLLGMPFNVLTGMITSLTVGLGVAYSIHLSERYNQELERRASMWDAMHAAVTGTGGALLGSAATTVGGFGVLAFAILPALQQFGIITGLTIIYAFLASVLVLPSLLVLWTRYLGPDVGRESSAPTVDSADVASDGGRGE